MAQIRDLKLDQRTLDIVVEDGDVVLIEDADVVAQQLRIRLRRQAGEWFLNTTSGVDYLGDVFPKGGAREAAIRRAIESSPYVAGLSQFSAEYDGATRSLSIEFIAMTEFGTVSVALEVP